MPYFVGLASIAVQSTAVDFMIRVSERLSCTAPSVANTAMPATTRSLVLTKVVLPLRLSKPILSKPELHKPRLHKVWVTALRYCSPDCGNACSLEHDRTRLV